MSKAFCMIMLIGLGVAATPALAQAPNDNADKVRDQIERLDGDALGDSRWRQPLRNFSARACPKAQPVMQATAWVAQQSISTKVIKQTLAVVIARSLMPSFCEAEHTQNLAVQR